MSKADEERASKRMVEKLESVIGGKPIDEIAPLLVVAVARMLFIDADGDPVKLNFLTIKFIQHLGDALNDMTNFEGWGETRQ